MRQNKQQESSYIEAHKQEVNQLHKVNHMQRAALEEAARLLGVRDNYTDGEYYGDFFDVSQFTDDLLKTKEVQETAEAEAGRLDRLTPPTKKESK